MSDVDTFLSAAWMASVLVIGWQLGNVLRRWLAKRKADKAVAAAINAHQALRHLT